MKTIERLSEILHMFLLCPESIEHGDPHLLKVSALEVLKTAGAESLKSMTQHFVDGVVDDECYDPPQSFDFGPQLRGPGMRMKKVVKLLSGRKALRVECRIELVIVPDTSDYDEDAPDEGDRFEDRLRKMKREEDGHA